MHSMEGMFEHVYGKGTISNDNIIIRYEIRLAASGTLSRSGVWLILLSMDTDTGLNTTSTMHELIVY